MPAVDINLGQFGGRVLQQVLTAGGRLAPGAALTAELCLAWPLRNRVALQNTGRVEFFTASPFATPQQTVDRMAAARAAKAAKAAAAASGKGA